MFPGQWRARRPVREAPEHGNNDGAGANAVAAGRRHADIVSSLRRVKIEKSEALLSVAVVVSENEERQSSGLKFGTSEDGEEWQ